MQTVWLHLHRDKGPWKTNGNESSCGFNVHSWQYELWNDWAYVRCEQCGCHKVDSNWGEAAARARSFKRDNTNSDRRDVAFR